MTTLIWPPNWIFYTVAIFLGVFGLLTFQSTLTTVQNNIFTEAHVIDYQAGQWQIQFLANGRQIETFISLRQNQKPNKYPTGSVISIHYPRLHPEKAKIEDKHFMWVGPILLLLFSAITFALTVKSVQTALTHPTLADWHPQISVIVGICGALAAWAAWTNERSTFHYVVMGAIALTAFVHWTNHIKLKTASELQAFLSRNYSKLEKPVTEDQTAVLLADFVKYSGTAIETYRAEASSTHRIYRLGVDFSFENREEFKHAVPLDFRLINKSRAHVGEIYISPSAGHAIAVFTNLQVPIQTAAIVIPNIRKNRQKATARHIENNLKFEIVTQPKDFYFLYTQAPLDQNGAEIAWINSFIEKTLIKDKAPIFAIEIHKNKVILYGEKMTVELLHYFQHFQVN